MRIRHAPRQQHGLRVVFDLDTAIKPRTFLLKANETYGDRLVIDLVDVASRPAATRTVQSERRRDVVIAIDAGHGGEDPGAIGPGGLHEKRVVLAIAKELESLFNREQGYRAVMIREGDYYIGLKQRRDLARKTQADLLISVHADAFTSPKAQGSSVYALSNRGASSAMAAFLAASENSTDAIGGVLIEGKDDDLVKILTDLSMTASLEASLRIGSHVLDRMGRLTHLHSKRVEQAAFAVLKAPDIPSILVETGFISNPEEARKLANAGHQRKLARAIFDGVHHHFSDSPPPDTYLAWSKSNRRQEYRISHGDTLSGIAQRYQVSVGALREHNGLNDNSIRAGQVLKIP
jgi:N-acetylmuramoyl-L-alanine amidase